MKVILKGDTMYKITAEEALLELQRIEKLINNAKELILGGYDKNRLDAGKEMNDAWSKCHSLADKLMH